MKKSIIWLLTGVMALTFFALLYFQIMYLENMVRMRDAQFSEIVLRCLSSTGSYLEKRETKHFLEEDIAILESSLLEMDDQGSKKLGLSLEVIDSIQGLLTSQSIDLGVPVNYDQTFHPKNIDNIEGHFRNMQQTLRAQYLYQKDLLNEVILSILREAGNRPAKERADSTIIRDYLRNELE